MMRPSVSFLRLLLASYSATGPLREFVGPGANLECGALVYKYFDGGLGACPQENFENWTP